MSEWPRICQRGSHYGSPVLAVDKYHKLNIEVIYLCRKHSIEDGAYLKRLGFKWEPLPETAQAQSTSEREQP